MTVPDDIPTRDDLGARHRAVGPRRSSRGVAAMRSIARSGLAIATFALVVSVAVVVPPRWVDAIESWRRRRAQRRRI